MSDRKLRIGFIINDSSTDYSKGLAKGMQQACYNYNCTLFIFPVGEFGMAYSQYSYQKRAVAALITKYNLDGLIFSSAAHGAHVSYEKLVEYIKSFSDIPVISLNMEIPGYTSVMADCNPGLDHMVSHLITKHKCKRIALMSAGENSKEAEERTQAYKNALEKNGIEFDESLVLYGFFSYNMAMKALEEYRRVHHYLDFDAIVCLNDYMAYAVVDYCKSNNIKIPDDLKITGFDDIPKTSMSDPTISTINQQIEKQGELALESLVKIIRKETVEEVIKVPTKVRYRQSCGCIGFTESYFDYQNEDYTVVSRDTYFRNISSSEWLIRKDQLAQIENYYANTQGQITLFDFTGKFQFVLTNFAIGAAAVVIYEQPVYMPEIFDYFKMPEKAYVLAAYDNSMNFNYKRDASTTPFDPSKELLPDGFINFYNETYFVVALSNCEYQYGYLVYKPGEYDETMYDLICTIFAHQLASAYNYSKEQEEKELLNKSNDHLRKISRTDELTKLLNRRGLIELGQEAIDLAIKCEKNGLVIFGDMDDLKKINDNYGHDAGDRAIAATAEILRDVFRATDIIARIGGDEFAIVAPGLNPYSYGKIKDKLSTELNNFNENSGEQFKLSISLGSTIFNSNSFALTALMLEADAKQYKEKKIKKNGKARNTKAD